jgi:hypothetical protein
MNIKFLFPTDRAWFNFWFMISLFLSLLFLKDLLKPEIVIILGFMVIYLLNEWMKDVEEYKKEEEKKNERNEIFG